MRQIELISNRHARYQRKGIDHDPVVPWNWATLPGRGTPVELVSYPVPALEDGATIDHYKATVMVRMTVGDPTTLREVPLRAVAAFAPSRHEWWVDRTRIYYDPSNPTVFCFADEGEGNGD